MALTYIKGDTVTLFTVSDLARAAGIPVPTMNNRIHRDGKTPAPTILFGRRRYYDADTFAALVESLKPTTK